MKKSVRNDGSGITDWVALQLDEENYLNCSIGTNIGLGGTVTILENITCVNNTGGSGMVNISSYINNHLFCFRLVCRQTLRR